ncbi:MAG: hypothetical protein M3220_18415, partial [Chloroflexota bacterium]|nr:hypothetical protein [Chloroflexota bacterium]
MKRILMTLLSASFVMFLIEGIATSPPASAQEALTGELVNIGGIPLGEVTVMDVEDNGIQVAITARGFDPVPGNHYAAITQAGICEPARFMEAGRDEIVLPEVQFFASGAVDYERTVEASLDALTDANGSALVIYANAG